MQFLEVGNPAVSETVINKSRFIGLLFPVFTEEEALEALNGIKKQYKDASHHCYAYMIGQNRGIMRYSDDGEPQGTAGLPMIEVLKQSNLTNVLMVCVRYFGGVLLGAGGLTRAYSGCTAQTVQNAVKLRLSSADNYALTVSYAAWNKIEFYFNQHGVTVTKTEYSDQVFVLAHEPSGAGVIKKAAQEFTNGAAACEYLGEITVKTKSKSDND